MSCSLSFYGSVSTETTALVTHYISEIRGSSSVDDDVVGVGLWGFIQSKSADTA